MLMRKEKAIQLLGGDISSAAKAIGISYQAVKKWPEVLSPAVSDRVVAALAKSEPSKWPQTWARISASSQRSGHSHPATNSTPAE